MHKIDAAIEQVCILRTFKLDPTLYSSTEFENEHHPRAMRTVPAITLVARLTEDPPTPMVGKIVGLIIPMISLSHLSICLYQKVRTVMEWSKLHAAAWLVLAIYIFSALFVVCSTAVLQVWGLNSSQSTCHIAIILCFLFYFSTKMSIYLFLVEKVHIVRSYRQPRLKSKLYCFNTFGLLSVYIVIGALDIIKNFNKIDENGVCNVVVQKVNVILIISYDAVINIYLTALFITPIKGSHSFNHNLNTRTHARLREVAWRSFIGSCATLISSLINLTVLIGLDGEQAWVCLMACSGDILFSAIVIQWVISKDNSKDLDQPQGNDRVNSLVTEDTSDMS